VTVAGAGEVSRHLPRDGSLVLFQTPLRSELARDVRQSHKLACFAHMPLYGRDPEVFRNYDLVIAVSRHVIASLKEAGISHYYPEPLYGVADLERSTSGADAVRARSIYDWDLRKFRDRLLSHLHPLRDALAPACEFKRREGLTLGIVSRLTPIKQFPLMFDILGPVLKDMPDVNLEIFGSGGYASVRDLQRSLQPLGNKVRWWGHQNDVKAVYPLIDFLLTGLPEKEALGLNVIEAQACGTPVLAVNAPPFTETVKEGTTGCFFADPRQDHGADFKRVLQEIRMGGARPQPLLATRHLEEFSFPRFLARVEQAMNYVLASE
jgi:glycosyltransferase involved in cell wall biosynthesis